MPFEPNPSKHKGSSLLIRNLGYDAYGRQATVTQPNQSKITYSYNPTTLALASELIRYDLDANGTYEFTRTLDRTRDSLLRDSGYSLKTENLTLETTSSLTYSPTDGRISQISNPQIPNQLFSYSYTPNSNLLASVSGPVHTVTNTWEPTRDVLDTKQNKVGSTVISGYDYAVNAIGQRTAVATSGTAFPAIPSWNWTYDPLGQVIRADSTVATSDRSYQYDAIGNRQKSADSLTLPAANNYATNSLNQYFQISNPQILNLSYDLDGNMTSGSLPTAPTTNSTLTWDAENRLTATTVGSTTTTYQYDAQSCRIAKTTGAVTTRYLYDAWNCIAEYSSSLLPTPTSTLLKTRLWGPDLSGSMQGVGGVVGLLSESHISNPQSLIYYPNYDGNGNISEYLTATGAIAAHFEYDPFGNTVVNTDTANLFSYRFSTEPRDPETGLYYYGYRYYDPMTGRWPTRDPLAEESFFLEFTKSLDAEEIIRLRQESLLNAYGFSRNRPINETDILGNYSCDTSSESGLYEVGPLNASFNLRFDAWSLLQHKTNPAANPAAQVGWQPCDDGDTINDSEVTAKPSPGSGGEYLSSAKTLLYLNVETRYALIHSGSDAQAASEAKFCCKCK